MSISCSAYYSEGNCTQTLGEVFLGSASFSWGFLDVFGSFVPQAGRQRWSFTPLLALQLVGGWSAALRSVGHRLLWLRLFRLLQAHRGGSWVLSWCKGLHPFLGVAVINDPFRGRCSHLFSRVLGHCCSWCSGNPGVSGAVGVIDRGGERHRFQHLLLECCPISAAPCNIAFPLCTFVSYSGTTSYRKNQQLEVILWGHSLGTGIALSALSNLLDRGKRCKGLVLEAVADFGGSRIWTFFFDLRW